MNTVASANETAIETQKGGRRRGCLFLLRRGLKWFGITLVVLVLLGVAYQTIATELDKRSYTPRGQFYTVNGHQMHMVCTGEGSPTVILQAGATAEALWWHRIQTELAQTTRVCAYDRLGLGWSDTTSDSRDALTLTSELHALLEQAGIEAPYLMAGHSFGAVLTRIYAAQYPEKVMGVVLVDSQFIDAPFVSQSDYDAWKTSNDLFQTPIWIMFRTGIARLFFSGQFQTVGYTPDIASELAALQMRNQSFDTDYAERISANWALREASAAAKDLGEIPLIVLWTPTPQGLYANEAALEAATVRRDEFATFSSNTVVRIVEGSDHLSLLGNEQHAKQVSEAIMDVMEAAQTGEPLVQ